MLMPLSREDDLLHTDEGVRQDLGKERRKVRKADEDWAVNWFYPAAPLIAEAAIHGVGVIDNLFLFFFIKGEVH